MKSNDSQQIVKLLEKKTRASAVELGTTKAIIEQLEEAGIVRRDGTIETGKRGRPPIAWVLADGKAPPVNEIPSLVEAKITKIPKSASAISKTIEEVLSGPFGKDCTCVDKDMSMAEIRGLGAGCAGEIRVNHEGWGVPGHVCPALDAVRRRLNA